MKRIAIVIGFILLGVLITGLEVNAIQEAKAASYVDVTAVKADTKAGTLLEERHLMKVAVLEETLSKDYYQNTASVIGKRLVDDVGQKTILTAAMLTHFEKEAVLEEGALTSIKLLPESALCWDLKIGDEVEVVAKNLDGPGIVPLGKVTVKGIYDHLLEDDAVPTYLLVRGEDAVIGAIIGHKKDGQLEIIKR